MPDLYYADELRHPPPPDPELCCESDDGDGGSSNNISGAGSPVGVVTPDALDQFYRSTTGPGIWQAIGLTNADWILWAGVDG